MGRLWAAGATVAGLAQWRALACPARRPRRAVYRLAALSGRWRILSRVLVCWCAGVMGRFKRYRKARWRLQPSRTEVIFK